MPGRSVTRRLKLDVSQPTDMIRKLNAELKKHNSSVNDIQTSNVKFNKEGKVTVGTFKAMAEGGRQVTVQMKQMGGVWKTVGDTIVATNAKVTSSEERLRRARLEHIRIMQIRSKRARDAMKSAERETFLTQRAINQSSIIRNRIAAEAAAIRQRTVARKEAIRILQIHEANRRRAAANAQRESFLVQRAINQSRILQRQLAQEAAARRITAAIAAQTAKRTITAGQQIILTWSTVIRLLQVQILHRNIALLAARMREAARDAITLGLRVQEIRAISLDANIATERWIQGIATLSDSFGNKTIDIAEAAYQALSNQVVHGAETFRFLAEEQKLAIISASSLTDAVKATTSIINSYGLASTDAARVNALLFKTIEIGRVRLSDMADTMGRVTILSSQLGVTLEETFAAFALLTRKGATPSRAITFLTNIFNKLIRPTDAMKKLFEELGVTSGEAAIQTFGFAGFLEILEKRARSSTDALAELGELFGRLRAITGATGLVLDRQSFEGPLGLGAFENAQENAAKAFNQTLESASKRIQIEFERLERFFTVDLGNVFKKAVLKISEITGGLVQGLQGVIFVAKNLILTFVTWKAATLALNIAIVAKTTLIRAYHLQLLVAHGRVTQLAAAQHFLQISMTGLSGFAIPALISGLILIWQHASNTMNRVEEAAQAAAAATERVTADLAAEHAKEVGETRKVFEKELAESLSVFFQYSADLRAENSSLMNALQDEYKELSKGIKDRLKEPVAALKKELRDLQNQQREAERQAERAADRLIKVERREDERKFRAGIRNLPEFDQIAALVRRVRDLRSLATHQFTNRDFDLSSQTLQQSFQQEDESVRRLLSLRKKLQSEIDRENKKKKEKDKDQEKILANTAQIAVINKGLVQLDAERTKFAKERIKLEMGLIKEQQLAAERIQKAAEAREESIKVLQRSFARLDTFDPKKGTPEEFNQLVKEAQAAATAAGIAGPERVELFRKILAQQLNLSEQFEIKRARKAIDIFDKQLREQQKRLKELRQEEQQAVDSLFTARTALDKPTAALAQRGIEFFGEEFDFIQFDKLMKAVRAQNIQLTGKPGDFNKRALQLSKDFKSIPQLLAQIRQLETRTRSGDVTAAELTKLDTLLERYRRILFDLEQLQGTTVESNVLGLNAPRTPGGQFIAKEGEFGAPDVTFQQEIRRLRNQIAALQEQRKAAEAVSGEMQRQKETVDFLILEIESLPEKYRNLRDAARTNMGEVEDAHQRVVDLLTEERKALDEVRAAQERIRARLKNDGNDFTVPGDAANRARGGMIPSYLNRGGHPGSPRGTDTIPAWLTPGEFVMNAAATRRFYPILQAMNRKPIYRQGGGPVNVGDVNVSVQGGDTSQSTIRAIAAGINREIRRGTINFGRN